MDKVTWPAGKADIQAPAYVAELNISVWNNKTILNPEQLTGNMTIDLDISAQMRPGAELIVKLNTAGTETTSFGTGIQAPDIVGVAGKTKVQAFVFDGVDFIATGTPMQID